MAQNRKNTRTEVLPNVNNMQVKQNKLHAATASSAASPFYKEEMAFSSVSKSNLQLQKWESNADSHTFELIFQQNDVKMYFISANGNIKSSLEHKTLRIIKLKDETADSQSTVYIEVGEWIYHLTPGVSPYFSTNFEALIFPELKGEAVGIVLPKDQCRQDVLDILKQITVHKRVPVKKRNTETTELSSRIAEGIIKGSQFISENLVRGAQKAGDLINAATPSLIENVTPATEPMQINYEVSTGLHIAKCVTGAAANVTGFVASRIGMATMALGRFLAPHIEKNGTKLLTSAFDVPEDEASKKVGNILTIAAGAAEGVGTIYQGLEESASILGSNLANNSVKLIDHKYGQSMGEAAGETFHIAGNLFSASCNMKYITPKGVLKSAAKATGQAYLENC